MKTEIIMKVTYRLIILFVICVVLWKSFVYFLSVPEAAENSIVIIADDSPDFEGRKTITVSVYYEALCSDSRFFILKQLVPTYDAIPEIINLDLVPYGKAQTIEKNGIISFECQHGQLECLANKIHACGLKYVKDPSLQLKYIACMIKDNMIPRTAGEKCAEDLGIHFQPIGECSDDVESSLLLKAYGDRTHALNPPVTFIPTIEIDNSQKISQSLLLKNLLKEICKLVKVKPKECL